MTGIKIKTTMLLYITKLNMSCNNKMVIIIMENMPSDYNLNAANLKAAPVDPRA